MFSRHSPGAYAFFFLLTFLFLRIRIRLRDSVLPRRSFLLPVSGGPFSSCPSGSCGLALGESLPRAGTFLRTPKTGKCSYPSPTRAHFAHRHHPLRISLFLSGMAFGFSVIPSSGGQFLSFYPLVFKFSLHLTGLMCLSWSFLQRGGTLTLYLSSFPFPNWRERFSHLRFFLIENCLTRVLFS